MGGLSAASLLANSGFRVMILEAAYAPGGCSSSFKRKGYIFESGATTLIGFDEHQPMRYLQNSLGITIPKTALDIPMAVYLNGKKIIKKQNIDEWISESIRHFGEPEAQKKFWKKAKSVSDTVWKVSGKNHFFPPSQVTDWVKLLKNNPADAWVLPYALRSVKKVAVNCGISNQEFFRFLDEQLIISAQSNADDTPFLFGAPALTYTNYTNYSVPGGLIEMVNSLISFVESNNGTFQNREKVTSVTKTGEVYTVKTVKGKTYQAPVIVSNIPIWNMGEITEGQMKNYFSAEAQKYDNAWGAVTLGVVTDDCYPSDLPLHHQIHLNDEDKTEDLDSDSIFVSLSHPDDKKRAPENERILNISTHTNPEKWFKLNGEYDQVKKRVEEQILTVLKKRWPYFENAEIKLSFSGTPITWSNWVYRKKGRVGGIPQSMSRSILDWTPNKTPFKGLYLAGDTVYPGQGIPGVTLSGINVYHRIKQNHKKILNH